MLMIVFYFVINLLPNSYTHKPSPRVTQETIEMEMQLLDHFPQELTLSNKRRPIT